MLIELFSPLLFLLVTISFVLWFYFQDNEKISGFFFRSSLLLLFVHILVLLVGLNNENKFQIITRDIALFGGIGLIYMALRLFKISRLLIVSLLLGSIFVLYKIGLKNAYKIEPRLAYQDETYAEFLIEISDADIDNFNKAYRKYIEALEPAFFQEEMPNTDLDEFYALNIRNEYIEEFNRLSTNLKFADYIEENEVITVDEIESQPHEQFLDFGFNDPLLSKQWGLAAIGYSEFLNILNGNSGLKPIQKSLLAILDSGIDGDHEDLQPNLIVLSDRAEDMEDKVGHGTHCAGIAGAVVNNGLGVASPLISTDLYEITSVKVLGDNGSGTQAAIIRGMIQAADMGADVISMSLGGMSTYNRRRAYNQAVEYVNKKGTIVVVAAGNSARNARNYAPANTNGVICVAALDEWGKKAKFSNTIEDIQWGVYAPGTNIVSTFPNNQYKTLNGTSMATPYVSALVAILKSFKPDLTSEHAFELLRSSSIQSNPNSVHYGNSLHLLLN